MSDMTTANSPISKARSRRIRSNRGHAMKKRPQKTDAYLKRILHKTIIELMDAGGTSGYWTANYLCCMTDLVEGYAFERVEALADQMLKSELPEMSLRFQRMFKKFNKDYFNGRLPTYT